MTLLRRYRSYKHHNKEIANAVEDLQLMLSSLGEAIEHGDPQTIADLWNQRAKPLLCRLEAP